MKKLKGAPNVVQYLECFYNTDSRNRVIQNLVMEFCELSLAQKLYSDVKMNDLIPMEHIRNFTR